MRGVASESAFRLSDRWVHAPDVKGLGQGKGESERAMKRAIMMGQVAERAGSSNLTVFSLCRIWLETADYSWRQQNMDDDSRI